MKLKLPNLVIIGVHKAASTSLFTYLSYHPDVFCPDKKEIHYFTPIRFGKPMEDIKKYAKYFEGANDQKYLLDASPSYFYGMEPVINKMAEVLPAHKVILTLREPTDRFVSFYNSLKAKLRIDKDETFSSFVNECFKRHPEPVEDNVYHRGIREGQYIDYLPTWVEHYRDDLKIIYFEELVANPESVMVDLAAWLGLEDSFFKNKAYTNENKTIYVKNKVFHTAALFVNNKMETFWRRNKVVKQKLRDLYYVFNKKPNQGKQVDVQEIEKLKQFYKPSNAKLAKYLRANNLKVPNWLQSEVI
jgi:hypothetical protein